MTALVVLPGLDGTATLHSAFSKAVGRAFESVTVIPYPVDRTLDYTDLELLVRSHLPTSGDFVLLGESFSGPVAISIASDPPINLLGLVLSTTFAESPNPLFTPLASLVRFAPVRTVPLFALSWWLLGRWATPQLEASLHSALHSIEPAVAKARAVAALRSNVLEKARAIAIPTLYLWATHDRLLSPRASSTVVSAIQNCVSIKIDGPHLLLQAAPEASAHAVIEFSAGLGC